MRLGEQAEPKLRYKHYVAAYTLCFAFLCAIIYSFFFLNGRTFLWVDDGFSQHYEALMYYATWLRHLFKNLLVQHRLIVPEWSFNIGLGSDIMTTLHYYAIGDPLNLFSVFVPTKYIHLFYGGLVFVRLYLAGLAFSWLCFQMKLRRRFGILAGALCYVFCGYTIFAAVRHPYFTNPMIFLPILIIGAEKVFKEKKPLLFTITVFLAAVSNFYFFYMLVLMTAIYVIARLVNLYHSTPKKMIAPFFVIVFSALLGVAMSGVLLLPMLNTFLTDGRAAVEFAKHYLYNSSLYANIPAAMFAFDSPGEWTMLSFSSITLASTVLLFRKRKQNGLLKFFYIFTFAALLLPLFGKIFNGFSYVSNRWIFCFALQVAFALALLWPDLLHASSKDLRALFIALGSYAALCLIISDSREPRAFIALGFLLVALIVLLPKVKNKFAFIKRNLQRILLIIIAASLFFNAATCFSKAGVYYANQFEKFSNLKKDLYSTTDLPVKNALKGEKLTSFYRYSGRDISLNTSLVNGTQSTQYYWSLSNGNIANFRIEMNMLENLIQNYEGFDDRTDLCALAAVRYFVVGKSDTLPIPYGYTKTSYGDKDYDLYENNYALPLGYTYSSYITRSAYDKLTSVQKQEALMQAMLLEDGANPSVTKATPVLSEKSVPFTYHCVANDVVQQDGFFVVKKKGAKLTLNFNGLSDSETYFCVRNFRYSCMDRYLQYYGKNANSGDENTRRENFLKDLHSNNRPLGESEAVSLKVVCSAYPVGQFKILKYITPNYSYYSGRQNFDVNLGYHNESVNSITLTFPEKGVYSFDDASVVCQPMSSYQSQISALKENVLENVDVSADKITGTVHLNEDKLLCLSIPYSEGWKAYVDGKEVPVLKANTMYMGISLSKGKHKIKLTYQTPYLKAGAMLSVLGVGGAVLVYAVLPAVRRKKKKV